MEQLGHIAGLFWMALVMDMALSLRTRYPSSIDLDTEFHFCYGHEHVRLTETLSVRET